MKPVVYEIIKTCTGDHGLHILYGVEQHGLPSPIELREHVIKKQHRLFMYDALNQFYLGKLETEGYCPLLSLGAIMSYIQVIDRKAEIIPMRAYERHALLYLPVPAF